MTLRHVFTNYLGFGGVQTLLHLHLREDSRFVEHSSLLALLEPEPDPGPCVRSLGKTRLTSSGTLRKRFLHSGCANSSSTWIYHNFWGAGLLADIDQGSRRIGFLHSSWPGYEDIISAQAGLFDGILCGDEMIRATVLSTRPDLPPDRVCAIRYPVPVPPRAGKPDPDRKTFRIGFCGRIEIPQKRVDRIPEFVRLLDEEPFDWELRLMGEGPALPDLRKNLAANPRIRFLGRLSGDAYWQELRSWDAIVFFSDYEGLPLAMLGAMACGVLPIYPRISSGGDGYAKSIHPSLLYDSNDLAAAASAARWLSRQPLAEIESLKARAGSLAEPHSEGNYLESFHGFVRLIESLPPAAVTPRRKQQLPDLLPLSAMLRFCPSAISKRL